MLLSYISFVGRFIKPLWFWASLIICATLAYAFLNAFFSYVLKLVVDALEIANRQDLLVTMKVPSLLFISTAFFMNVTLRIRMMASSVFYPRLQRAMTVHAHKLLQRQVLGHFKEQLTGGIVNRAVEFNRTLTSMLELLTVGLFALAQILVYMIFLWQTSVWFCMVYLIWLSVFIPVSMRYGFRANHLAKHYADSQSTMMGQMMDSINNIYFVKLFSHQNYEQVRIEGVSDDTLGKAVNFKRYLIRFRWLMDGFVFIIMLAYLSLLLYLYKLDQVTAGDFVFVLTSIIEMTWYVSDFCGERLPLLIEEYGKGVQAFHLFNFCENQSDDNGTKELSVRHGAVDFESVNFAYQDGGLLFDGFNMHVKPGEKVGLVGYSGSGKTSLMHLLLGFYKPGSGEIKLDGQSIIDVKLSALRRYIAMIPQDTALFHRSLRENIRYGDLSASDEAVEEAAKKAHAHEFIMQLPDGYETMVGERGLKLSGGQRQRIAIARAFLKNAPVLLLDEATSALDTVTEQAIYSSLQALMDGRTVIVIAHRLSTIKSMDRIIVMDKGHIVEQGKHHELISLGGHYANMWRYQVSDDILT